MLPLIFLQPNLLTARELWPQNKKTEMNDNNSNNSLFMKALNYEIPENMIETIKDKNNPNARVLKYISWSYAWATFKQLYPDAKFRVIHNPATNLPYFYDPEAGIMVETEITAGGETQMMWLFVMNGANKAMKLHPYTYQSWSSYSKSYEEKTVQAATMFDISKTLLRCLVKNMAIFGFGLDLYSKQDLPEVTTDNNVPQHQTMKPVAPQKPADPYAGIKNAINGAADVPALMSLYLDHQGEIEANPSIKQLLTNRKLQLQNAA